jgi:hypothetical protein
MSTHPHPVQPLALEGDKLLPEQFDAEMGWKSEVNRVAGSTAGFATMQAEAMRRAEGVVDVENRLLAGHASFSTRSAIERSRAPAHPELKGFGQCDGSGYQNV